jgi:hypothetical protein
MSTAFTFPLLFYLFPRSHATQQRLSMKLPPAEPPPAIA